MAAARAVAAACAALAAIVLAVAVSSAHAGSSALPPRKIAATQPAGAGFAGPPSPAYLIDQMGSLTIGGLGNAYYSQDLPGNPAFTLVVEDDFTLATASIITAVDFFLVAIGPQPIWSALNIRVAISTTYCRSSVVGNVANVVLAGTGLAATATGTAFGFPTAKMSATLPGGGLTLSAGTYYISIQVISDTSSFYVGVSTINEGAAGAWFSNPGESFLGVACDAISGSPSNLAFRLSGGPACTPNVQEFVCSADFDSNFRWCALPAYQGTVNCAPGTRCRAGSSSHNPCTVIYDASAPPPAPCASQGYQCSAGRPNDYYVCSSTFNGWQPCAAGTTCTNTAGIFIDSPCR